MPEIVHFIHGREGGWRRRAEVYQAIRTGISCAQNQGWEWKAIKVGDRYSPGLGCQAKRGHEGGGPWTGMVGR